MIRYNGYIAVVCYLLFLMIGSTVSADENNQMQIHNVQVDSLSYVGQDAVIAFDLKSTVDMTNVVISVLLESTMTNEEFIASLEASASDGGVFEADVFSESLESDNFRSEGSSVAVDDAIISQSFEFPKITQPKYYLATILVDQVLAQKEFSFSQLVTVPNTVVPGTYKITINIEKGMASELTTIVDNTFSAPSFSASFSEEYMLVQPDLPNLKLSDIALAGSHGYALSKSDLPNEIRLNMSTSAMLKDVDQNVGHSFTLSISGVGDFTLSVRQTGSVAAYLMPEWKLEAECMGCVVLKKGATKSATLSLVIDRDLKEKIMSLASGTVIFLKVQIDPLNEIPEWNNNKKDNTVILKIAVLN